MQKFNFFSINHLTFDRNLCKLRLVVTQSSHEIQIARRIKSRAQIAQLVEQRTENPRVTGSIPVLGISQDTIY